MLEKPDIPDEKIIASLQKEYGLLLTRLAFLPLGGDLSIAVYGNQDRAQSLQILTWLFLPDNSIEIALYTDQSKDHDYLAVHGKHSCLTSFSEPDGRFLR